MTQYEQVIEVMKANGGYATLGYLNHMVDVSTWKSKTPFASIRRIVQDERFFFRIKPGLWALNEFKNHVLEKFDILNDPIKELDFTHTYYQGLLLEIGNLKGYKTYVPAQDKNRLFMDKRLREVSTTEDIYEFSYNEIVKRAKTIDVIWFNERKLPNSFFEVEHTTDIQNSLLKFNDLIDFYSNFYILSDKAREREFDIKIHYSAFRNLKNRVKFINYDYISNLHSKLFELSLIEKL